ncbi:MAG: hypothetical protein AAFN27_22705 [Pseudomonadota bacterium]
MRFSQVIELDVDTIKANAPDSPGIYEVGYWVEPNYFVPRYLGRARGRLDGDPQKVGTSIRSRLLSHAKGKGNKNIARALSGDHEEYWLDDPDTLSQAGRHKMTVDDVLWCRWMVARLSDDKAGTAADREASLLEQYGVGKTDQYVWNEREERRS